MSKEVETFNVKEIKDTLPDRPSELIRLALNDLNKIEKLEQYTVNMNDWHVPYLGDGKAMCAVCLAGAVLAQTLHVPAEVNYYSISKDMPASLDRKIDAINCFRTGDVYSGFRHLLRDKPDEFRMNEELFDTMDREICSYHTHRELFHERLLELAADLEKLGY